MHVIDIKEAVQIDDRHYYDRQYHFVYKGHHHHKPRIAQPKEITLCILLYTHTKQTK